MPFWTLENAMSYLKSKLHPLEKYLNWIKFGALGLCASVWVYALIDQMYTSAGAMKYLLMSLIILAIALI
jgi:hypothetical protein